MRVDAVEMADPEGHRLTVARAQLDTAAAAHAARAAAHTTRVRLLDAPAAGIAQGALVLLGSEVLLVLTEVGEYTTVRRAQRGTAAAVHAAGSAVATWRATVDVQDAGAAGLTAPGKRFEVGGEVMELLAVSGNRLSVVRARLGTVHTAHTAGDAVRTLLPGYARGHAAPLLVHDPGFSFAEIGQSVPFRAAIPDTPNVLGVTLIPNRALRGDEGARVTLAGIASSAGCDRICETAFPAAVSHPCRANGTMPFADLHASAAHDVLGVEGALGRGEWTISAGGEGVLVIPVRANATLERDVAVVFSFAIHNPEGSGAAGCAAAAVTATATGATAFNAEALVPRGRSQVMSHDLLRVPAAGAAAGDAAPLKMLPCAAGDCLGLARIGQFSHLPAQRNTLTVTLAARGYIPRGGIPGCHPYSTPAAFTLTGLSGPLTPSTALSLRDSTVRAPLTRHIPRRATH